MQDNKKAILLTCLGIIFIASTVYLNMFSSPKQETKSSDLVSILKTTNTNKTGLSDVPEGQTVPNWKKAVLAEADAANPNLKQVADADQTQLNDPNNITAQYAKDVYAATAILQQQGRVLTEQDKADIAQSVFAQEALKAAAKVFTIKDIKTFTANASDVQKYGNTLGGVATLAIVDGSNYLDVPLFEDYAKTLNKETLKKIDKKIAIITQLRDSLLVMNVPTSAILYHLNALNSVEAYRQTLINMRSFETDALRATIGAHDYVTVFQTTFTTINAFSEYFDNQNIIFKPDEKGYIFTKGLITP